MTGWPENPKIMQSIVRMVRDHSFVHFYLVCGHMITMTDEDLKETPPTSIECWACEEEANIIGGYVM
jgi:hypothetical protein